MNKNVLVSVIIATYNSSSFILETLNSVHNQYYQNIELVISDDNSTDDTYDKCEGWLNDHKERFHSSLLVKNPSQRGIAPNYNNALSHASGEWIKYLDSDDLLLPNCIDDYIEATKKRPEINVWISGWELVDIYGKIINRQPNIFPMTSAHRQLRSYLVHIQDIHTNTFFIRKNTLNSIGGFDSRFPMTQDIPLIYNLLASGNRFGILKDTYTFQFRQVMSSVSRSGNSAMGNDIAECRYYYSRLFLRYGLIHYWYNAWLNHWIRNHHNKKAHKCLGYFLRCFDIVNLWTKLKY